MTFHSWFRLFALWLLLQQGSATTADTGSQSESRRLVAIEDISAIIDIGAPRFSPDGKWIAYESEDRIFLVSTRSGPVRPVTESASTASDPYWSGDGTSLYFLSDRSGTSQLWKLGLEEFGEASQVTELEVPVQSIKLSPDETRLLLLADAASKEDPAAKVKKPWVMERLQFKEDADDGYITDDPPGHVQVYELSSRKLKPVTSGAYTEFEASTGNLSH